MVAQELYIAGKYDKVRTKLKEATERFQEMKDKDSSSQIVGSGDVDKYLASLGVTK